MGAELPLDRRHIRFGVFDLDTVTGELRKHGVRVRLQDQPLKLLLFLLETPGEVCTREALIHRIWPEGTFVDYDRGLNSAATRLRQVIGYSADAPRNVDLDPDMTPVALGTSLAPSPDGTRLVVAARGSDGSVRLATRRLDQSQL